MKKKYFTVTFTARDDAQEIFSVEATSDRAAVEEALKLAGLPDAIGFEVDVQSDESRDALHSLNSLTHPGWIVKATTRDGNISNKQYLVAVQDPEKALQTVRDSLGHEVFVALTVPVDSDQLNRRGMKVGDVLQLRTNPYKKKPNG